MLLSRLTKTVRLLCAVALPLLAGGCGTTTRTGAVTETERAVCDAWRDSLPSRSRSDTIETRHAIGRAYDEFLAACPDHSLAFPEPPSEKLGPSAGGGG